MDGMGKKRLAGGRTRTSMEDSTLINTSREALPKTVLGITLSKREAFQADKSFSSPSKPCQGRGDLK
jgi:hypothetical protein